MHPRYAAAAKLPDQRRIRAPQRLIRLAARSRLVRRRGGAHAIPCVEHGRCAGPRHRSPVGPPGSNRTWDNLCDSYGSPLVTNEIPDLRLNELAPARAVENTVVPDSLGDIVEPPSVG